jgi:hypothetical protein
VPIRAGLRAMLGYRRGYLDKFIKTRANGIFFCRSRYFKYKIDGRVP